MKDKALDVLGIKPVSKTINTAVSKSIEGVEAFLKMVCAPALDEVGLMMKDQVRNWRLKNILTIMEKAKGKIHFENDKLQIKAHPRVALSIIENASLIDNDEVQELWAGLFASSCTENGQDDQNLIFVNLLKQLTVPQAKILKFGVENSRKILFTNGLVLAEHFEVTGKKLIKISGVTDVHRIDRELDHLRSLELIGSEVGKGGFNPDIKNLIADITPSGLALNLYVKSQGYSQSTRDYWKDSLIPIKRLERLLKKSKKIKPNATFP